MNAALLDELRAAGFPATEARGRAAGPFLRGAARAEDGALALFVTAEGEPLRLVRAETDEARKDVEAILARLRKAEENDAEDAKRMRTKHPGQAFRSTPDDPTRGEKWHKEKDEEDGETTRAKKAADTAMDELRKSVAALERALDRPEARIARLERKFLEDEEGLTRDEILAPGFRMSGPVRVRYSRWLTKALRDELDAVAARIGGRS